MTKKETIKLYDHSLAVSQLTLHGYQEECMKCEISMQGVKHFKKNKKTRKYFSFTIALIFPIHQTD